MGNSTGNLKEYWDLIRSEPRLIGGYIWDWIDQGLPQEADDGRRLSPTAVITAISLTMETSASMGLLLPIASQSRRCGSAKKFFSQSMSKRLIWRRCVSKLRTGTILPTWVISLAFGSCWPMAR